MSDSNDISNNSGPGSGAEPSMEEILASIRRILREDEGMYATPEDADDDDVLVLDASMMVTPPDISTATQLPADTGSIAVHEEPPPAPAYEPLHFVSGPALDDQDHKEPPETPEAALPAGHEDSHEDEEDHKDEDEQDHGVRAGYKEHEMEDVMEDHVQSPEGLIGDAATSEIANTIGSLVRSISTERAVSVSRGGITIEDIVREEVKPVLKAWFDTHLPSLVERIVRAEIGRLIDRTQV